MKPGKEKCEILKSIRMQIAKQYGLEYSPSECHNPGNCSGTCPKCDAEIRDLQMQLDNKGIEEVNLIVDMPHIAEDIYDKLNLEGEPRTEGLVPDPVTLGKKRVLYKECRIAGTAFHNLDDIWYELYEGAQLALVRQKRNEYDINAVAVALAGDYDGNPDNFDFDFILGYVPRNENEFLATMLDMGWAEIFECELSRIEGRTPNSGSLYMEIYIVNK